MPEVAETGATFAENALLKAQAIAEFTGLPAVADDSGLCVDALNGMPGVLSARWSGRHGDDEANLWLVLAQLADVPDERRGAHFACAAALVLPSGREQVTEGTVSRHADPRAAGHERVRLRPDLRARPAELARGGDPAFAGLTTAEMTRGGQGRDQPPGPRAARAGPDHRRAAGLARACGPVRVGRTGPPRREHRDRRPAGAR